MSAARIKLDKDARESIGAKSPQTSADQRRAQKSIAKLGMTGSLGALFVSGFFKFHGAKQLHIYSGFGWLRKWCHREKANKPKPE